MRLLLLGIQLIIKTMNILLIAVICIPLLFIAMMGSQPMQVPQVPKGMTYWEFISDRVEAAKVVNPSRCGWGMFLSLAALGPIYSVVYTEVAIHPDGFLAKVTAPDPDIPKELKMLPGMKSQAFGGMWWSG